MSVTPGTELPAWRVDRVDPEKMKLFRPFVNSERSDPSIVMLPLREQHRPATWEEKEKKKAHG